MNKIAESAAHCNQTNIQKFDATREHDTAVAQFTKNARTCSKKTMGPDGCNDDRNKHLYCRWWACPLTKENTNES